MNGWSIFFVLLGAVSLALAAEDIQRAAYVPAAIDVVLGIGCLVGAAFIARENKPRRLGP